MAPQAVRGAAVRPGNSLALASRNGSDACQKHRQQYIFFIKRSCATTFASEIDTWYNASCGLSCESLLQIRSVRDHVALLCIEPSCCCSMCCSLAYSSLLSLLMFSSIDPSCRSELMIRKNWTDVTPERDRHICEITIPQVGGSPPRVRRLC